MNNDSMEVQEDKMSTKDFQEQVTAIDAVATRFQDRRFVGRDVREVLRQLFYYIQVDLGINPERWGHLVDFYVEKHTTADKSPTEIRSAIKKNFQSASQMTVAMFCRALKLLPIVRVRFGVTLVFANNKATDHGIWFNINDVASLEGIDKSIGDVQAPIRYRADLHAKTGIDQPIVKQEGDNDLLAKLKQLAAQQTDQTSEGG